jgi:hypothetical protein
MEERRRKISIYKLTIGREGLRKDNRCVDSYPLA